MENPITKKKGRSARRFDSLKQEAYLAIWRTYDRLRALEDELFSQWDLTAQQYNILRLLRSDHPNQVPTLSLVGRLVSRAPDVSRMLDKLEARHLIVRNRSSEDRRTVLVGVTADGLAIVDGIAEPLRQCHEAQLGHLQQAELKSLVDLLRRAREPHEPADSPWR